MLRTSNDAPSHLFLCIPARRQPQKLIHCHLRRGIHVRPRRQKRLDNHRISVQSTLPNSRTKRRLSSLLLRINIRPSLHEHLHLLRMSLRRSQMQRRVSPLVERIRVRPPCQELLQNLRPPEIDSDVQRRLSQLSRYFCVGSRRQKLLHTRRMTAFPHRHLQRRPSPPVPQIDVTIHGQKLHHHRMTSVCSRTACIIQLTT
mmetsp:Transcript_1018/g.2497  ORF Transcript_1018/g.2497 Transcript_1018/m.2497 type:complete len:201 (-) Transcript_1018:683-1285(-)